MDEEYISAERLAAVTAGTHRVVHALTEAIRAEPDHVQGAVALAASMAALLGLIAHAQDPAHATITILEKFVRDAQERGWLPNAGNGGTTTLVFGPATAPGVPRHGEVLH